uniref:hypothetical protein n=1 Tax=Mailhella massiliensis TaxID=1903261 RepID=UPI002355A800
SKNRAAHSRRCCFMQLFISTVNNFFQSFFQRSAFGVSSFEPLCLSAFSSYARFTPFCQTLFSHFSGYFSPILRILPIKLTIGNKNFSFFLFRRTAFSLVFPRKTRKTQRRSASSWKKGKSTRSAHQSANLPERTFRPQARTACPGMKNAARPSSAAYLMPPFL